MKRLLGVFITPLLLLVSVNIVSAQSEPMTLVAPDYRGGTQLTGEIHNYSLILKGNGNAVVLGRINFTNTDTSAQGNYTLTIPGEIENLVAFQEIPKDVCVEYVPSPFSGRQPDCAKYGPPSYPDPYNSDYKKIEVSSDGSKHTFQLAEGVKEASNSGIVFSYNSTSFIKKSFGKFNFKFETPKAETAVQNLNLSIDTDNKSLLLDVDNEQVNYSQTTDLKVESFASDGAVRNLAPMIGTSGRVYKSVSSLTAGESLTVTGSFANSIWLLHLDRILWFIITLLAVLLVIIILVKANFWSKWYSKLQKLSASDSRAILMIDVVGSLISSALVFGTILLLSNLLENNGLYQILPVPSGLGSAMTLLVSLLALVFVLLVLALPSLIIGFKFGWRHTLFYILFEFMWLVVMVIGFAILFSSTDGPQIYPLSSPAMREKAVETDVRPQILN